MNTTLIKTTALALSSTVLFSACDTVEGARFAQSLMPTFYVGGPGGRRTFRVPEETFMSPRLKFQTAVVKNNVAAAARHLRPEWVNAPIKGYPPIYYAAVNGGTPMTHLLVRNGASVGFRAGGRSLAYAAASHGQFGTASELVNMGGGTSGDITRGRALYAENMAIQRRQAAAFTAAALIFLDAAMRSSSGGGRDQFGNSQSDYDRMSLKDAADSRQRAGGERGGIY